MLSRHQVRAGPGPTHQAPLSAGLQAAGGDHGSRNISLQEVTVANPSLGYLRGPVLEARAVHY